MSRRLPTRKEALSFLVKAGCSPEVVRHAKAVAALAVEIAEARRKKGSEVDIQLVEIGALLHDIGRSKTHSVNHVIVGVEIAKSLGLPDSLVSLIERHAGSGIPKDEAQKLGWPVKDYVPQTLEEKIVTYADKLIEGLRRVSIEQVLEKFLKDNLPKSSIQRMKRLHKEFSPLLGDLDAEKITLLEKVYGPFSQQLFQAKLASLCKDLTVEAKVVGKTNRGWVQVEIAGEDQKVAMEFLEREIGVAPVNISKVKKFSTIRGRVIFAGEKDRELLVDIGVHSPRVYDATIPLELLQAQLADGNKLPLQRLIELFCLYDHMPLHVKITRDVRSEREQVEAELSETQISKFMQWINFSLDRLIVFGATLSQVEHAIKVSGHDRDIIRVETLGLLEHAVVCKLGTDAIGLTPKLGPHLYKATLAPFSPRKIQKTIDRPFL